MSVALGQSSIRPAAVVMALRWETGRRQSQTTIVFKTQKLSSTPVFYWGPALLEQPGPFGPGATGGRCSVQAGHEEPGPLQPPALVSRAGLALPLWLPDPVSFPSRWRAPLSSSLVRTEAVVPSSGVQPNPRCGITRSCRRMLGLSCANRGALNRDRGSLRFP